VFEIVVHRVVNLMQYIESVYSYLKSVQTGVLKQEENVHPEYGSNTHCNIRSCSFDILHERSEAPLWGTRSQIEIAVLALDLARPDDAHPLPRAQPLHQLLRIHEIVLAAVVQRERRERFRVKPPWKRWVQDALARCEGGGATPPEYAR